MEEAQLCSTHFTVVLHCTSHTPACWLKQAAHGHHQPPGKVSSLPRACCRMLGKQSEVRREGKRKRERRKGGEEEEIRLLRSEINKKLPTCLPCIPLF